VARRNHRHRRRTPPGAAPGTLIADPNAPKPNVRLIAYSSDDFVEKDVRDLCTIADAISRWPVTWINVDGLGDVDAIASLADMLGLHRLAVEDTINTHQRAKVEHYRNHMYLVAHMACPGEEFHTEQLSLFLGSNFVITFQEGHPGDPFEPIRSRIRSGNGGGQLRQAGADYLAYSLIDAVIDGYFPILEGVGERLEAFEDEILSHPTSQIATHVHQVKRDLMALRRTMWPLREAMNSLVRDTNPLITQETKLYLRDCYDHTIRIIDFVETYRELGSDLMDLYLSSINQRMTEVMKVLTIISTIFIPLTFIAGLYGMNFHTERSPWNMPELTWYLGYPFSLSMMAAVSVGMLFFFRRKGWIGAGAGPAQKQNGEEAKNLSHRDVEPQRIDS
jgi:magnesium transporter